MQCKHKYKQPFWHVLTDWIYKKNLYFYILFNDEQEC